MACAFHDSAVREWTDGLIPESRGHEDLVAVVGRWRPRGHYDFVRLRANDEQR